MAFVGIHRQIIEYGDLTCQYRGEQSDFVHCARDSAGVDIVSDLEGSKKQ